MTSRTSALAIAEVVKRAGIQPADVEEVYFGCANQAGEDNRNVARMAGLLAGLPIEVAGQTVNRLCGSGLQAVASAAQAIKAGEGDAFVAGGVESRIATEVASRSCTRPPPFAHRCVTTVRSSPRIPRVAWPVWRTSNR